MEKGDPGVTKHIRVDTGIASLRLYCRATSSGYNPGIRGFTMVVQPQLYITTNTRQLVPV